MGPSTALLLVVYLYATFCFVSLEGASGVQLHLQDTLACLNFNEFLLTIYIYSKSPKNIYIYI